MKKLTALLLAMAMALSCLCVPGMAVETSGNAEDPAESAAAFAAVSTEVLKNSTSVTSWGDLYASLGASGSYDVVTSATQFGSFHAKDIPSIVNRVTNEEGDTVGLDGVVLSGKSAEVQMKLSSGSYAYTSKYGFGEFAIVPDDTVEGYVWNDYFTNLYAATISDGTTTVGALPWVDYYGESATSGPHYNKVQISLNSGTSVGSNKADVHRFDAFVENGALKPGTYTVTLYAEGYSNLTAEIPVLAVSGASVTANNTAIGSASTTITGVDTLPADFDAAYAVDGVEQTMSVSTGRFTTYSVSLPEGLSLGSHTLTISDKSGKYVDVTAAFQITTDKLLAVYDAGSTSLVKAEGISDDEFAAYLKAITSVSVNGTAYAATGRGAVKIVNDATGAVSLDKFTDNAVNNMVVTATGYTTNVSAIVTRGTVEDNAVLYATMNVPYADFYAAENADEQVDVVSTATTSKFKGIGSTGLAQGTYNDGTNICGVTAAVQMTYAQFAAMYDASKTAQNDGYISAVSTTAPAACMVLNADGSCTAMAPEKDASGLSVIDYTNSSAYGDYQISLGGVATSGLINGEQATILGAVMTTTDSKSYAMYALDNLWYGTRVPNVEIAWSVKGGKGLKKAHGKGPAFYEYDMNGKTLKSVKVITSIGSYTIPCDLTLDCYHNIQKVEAKAATYTEAGCIEHYKCGYCGKCYSDAEGTNEISEESTVLPKLEKKSQTLTVKAGKTSFTYNASKEQNTTLTVSGAKTKVTYTTSNANIYVKSGKLYVKKGTKAGSYTVKVSAAASDTYKAASKTITVKVVKAANPMTVKAAKTSVKYNKKKAQTIKLTVSKAQGSVTYKSSNSKYVTVSAKGVITVKKAAKKGKYTITVTAKGNANYNAATKKITITVK